MRKIQIEKNIIKNIGKGFKRFQKFNKSKNLSDKTLEYYEETYLIFEKFLKENGVEYFPEMNRELLEDYTLYLKEQDLSENSINTYLRGIRTFLYYIMNNGWLERFKVHTIKTTKSKPKGYNEEQLTKLIKKPDMKQCTFARYRNWVIVNFLLDTGIRANSLINIKINDLNIPKEYVEIKYNKSRRERNLPLSKTMIEILHKYLDIRGGEPQDYLFPSVYGNKFTRSGLTSAIKAYNRSRGIDHTSIHGFRHSFSRLFIKNGGTISQLRKILGHKNIETTDKYVNLLISDFKDDYSTFNPLENLLGRKKSIKINE